MDWYDGEYFEEEEESYSNFDYSKCWEAWGYDPEKHGDPTLRIVRVIK